MNFDFHHRRHKDGGRYARGAAVSCPFGCILPTVHGQMDGFCLLGMLAQFLFCACIPYFNFLYSPPYALLRRLLFSDVLLESVFLPPRIYHQLKT